MRFRSFVCLVALAAPARAEFPRPTSADTSSPYPPVQITHYKYDHPRPLRAWAVRIDLADPNVEPVITPKVAAPDGFEALSETTLAFAESHGVQLAVNGGPYSPLRAKPREPLNISGLHLSRGETVSPADEKRRLGVMLLTGVNTALVRPYPVPEANLAAARHGLGGFRVVVAGGNNLLAGGPAGPAKHPRTAAGASDDGKVLWWLVVDGRQPGKSEGLTYEELGEWALSLGITELLNLDGGGSTTLVLQDPATGKQNVVNSPVGTGPPGSLRQNGNAFGIRIYNRAGDLTAAQLRAVMPRLPAERVPLFLGPLNRAMAKHKIDNPARRAAFLAQLAHESGELKYMEEIASGEAYEGRKSLGNTQPGDGKRYKGRGPIQLTGRSNYRRAGATLGIDLENHPERAADPEVGCRVAGWFWETHGLNALADAGDFRQITRRINGGYNGLARREAYWARAKEALGVATGK
jgi:predicted chitinase